MEIKDEIFVSNLDEFIVGKRYVKVDNDFKGACIIRVLEKNDESIKIELPILFMGEKVTATIKNKSVLKNKYMFLYESDDVKNVLDDRYEMNTNTIH